MYTDRPPILFPSHLQCPEGEVCIGVQPIHLGALLTRERLNGRPEGVNISAVRDAVAEATALILVDLHVGLLTAHKQ